MDWREDRIGAALRGENPTVMARLPRSFAVIGDVQFLPGYSVLLVDDPEVDRLTDLPLADRRAFLDSLDLLAEAVSVACAGLDPAFRRVNIEILGNTDAYLHAHVFPRFDWEEPARVTKPVWLYGERMWRNPHVRLGPDHDIVRSAITRAIEQLRSERA